MREELLKYQYDFYQNAKQEVHKDKNKAIVFGDRNDKGKTYQFAKMLERQHIKFHKLSSSVTAGGTKFMTNDSYMIPADQPNYRMIKAMFETRTSFQDSLFYDVSAWTLPMAFDLNYGYTNSLTSIGEVVHSLDFPVGRVSLNSDYAYVFEWDEYYTPKALYTILKNNLRAKVATKPFSIGNKKYDYGTILIPVANQVKTSEEIHSILKEIAKETGVDFDGATTGITTGIDLGSTYFKSLEQPKIAVLVGDGITSSDAGEIWHLLDTRYQIPITKLDTKNLGRADLSKYTTIIISNTFGSSLNNATDDLKTFVKNGGVLIGYRNALRWLESKNFINLDFKKSKITGKDISFADRADFRGAQVIGGAIFEAEIDLTHPIGYGYNKNKIALFRNTTLFINPDSTNYKKPLQYTKKALLSGYISKENLKAIKGTIPFKTASLGRGEVIVFTDNTNFRAFWYGTNKLLMNAIFFGKMM
ncbi:hypothetical protein [Aureibaculum algae]|uniref:hypothetical protein n=1 Tax=Aureibaculum algae TaxID=2584122 RepID=UPI0026CA6796|nr:hypothetical protein [Aureibaculum algae]